MSINSILLRRKQKVLLAAPLNTITDRLNQNDTAKYVASFVKNLEPLGYTLSKEVIEVLMGYNITHLTTIYREVISQLRIMVGAHVRFMPMYPNFPEQVMEASEAELFINAIVHYMTAGELVPDYEKVPRAKLKDITKLKAIGLGTEDDVKAIGKNLIASKTSLSQTDKEDLTAIAVEYGIINLLPEEIPLKENVALVTKLILMYAPENSNTLSKYMKTATDVLRLAVALSNGDVSLAENTKFGNFKRAERRLILSLLENIPYTHIEEDMARYTEVWKRLGERLHPAEYKEYTKVNAAFKKLRNGEKMTSFNGLVAKMISEIRAIRNGTAESITKTMNQLPDSVSRAEVQKNCMSSALYLLLSFIKHRPGEFARKLDMIIRAVPEELATNVVEAFAEVSDKVSVPVLLQVMAHFKSRSQEKECRIVFPKGVVSKATTLETKIEALSEEICAKVVEVCHLSLINHFKDREALGNVYVDPGLKKLLVPFSQRSASKALKTIVRGSRIVMEDCRVIRAFLHWKQNAKTGRCDIDLSAILYRDDWTYVNHISFTNLRDKGTGCCHSGDFVAAGKGGASEFIDIDIAKAKAAGIRYVVFTAYSFSGQLYKDLPECFMGWMARKYPEYGEIFDPATVQNKFDLSADATKAIPVLFDLETMEFIWCDLSIKSGIRYGNSVENTQGSVSQICKGIINMVKPNLYDLFALHARARGNLVDTRDEADTVFAVDSGTCTPMDIEKIMSEYL